MKNILIIHQSSELYGSDKTILMLVLGLNKSKYNPTIVLPSEGPLKEEFEKKGIKVIIAPVLKVHRKLFFPKNFLTFLKEYKKSLNILNTLHKEQKFDLVYSQTLAVLVGIIFAQKNKIKHLWHVHEIIEKPKVINTIFTKLLSLKSNHKAVYNSQETMGFWAKSEKLKAKSECIVNGLDINDKPKISEEEIKKVRNDFYKVNSDKIVIGLVGRINKWKGQQLLLKAFDILEEKNSNIKLVFLGSPPDNQEIFLTELEDKIKEFQLESKAEIIPFQKNIWKFWEAIDIAVVPSTEPEPFGMVAVEAMLCKKPVIAANHGGLTEIVLHNQTGFLFEPNNENQLAEYLQKLIDNSDLRDDFGKNGYQRVLDYFSLDKHIQKFEQIFEEVLK